MSSYQKVEFFRNFGTKRKERKVIAYFNQLQIFIKNVKKPAMAESNLNFTLNFTSSKPRSSRPEAFCKKFVLRNFAKHLCQCLLIKLQA